MFHGVLEIACLELVINLEMISWLRQYHANTVLGKGFMSHKY